MSTPATKPAPDPEIPAEVKARQAGPRALSALAEEEQGALPMKRVEPDTITIPSETPPPSPSVTVAAKPKRISAAKQAKIDKLRAELAKLTGVPATFTQPVAASVVSASNLKLGKLKANQIIVAGGRVHTLDPHNPHAGLSHEDVAAVMARTFRDEGAPATSPMLGDETPEYREWVFKNRPAYATVRYFAR